jgi:hypothetical protein
MSATFKVDILYVEEEKGGDTNGYDIRPKKGEDNGSIEETPQGRS